MSRRCALPLGLVALVLAVYSSSLSAPFIWDDEDTILHNPVIRSVWPPWEPLRESSLPSHPLLNRPLVSLSFAVNYAAGGLDVRGYRAVNIALHVASVLLLFGVAGRTLERLSRRSRLFQRRRLAAWSLAALWAVHPVGTEAVAYITQRTTLMTGFFMLLTLYACLRFWSAGTRHRGWMATAVAACAAGMACKETMVSAPVVVFLYDWAFLSGSARCALRDHARLHGLLASTWLVLIALLATGGHYHNVGLGLPMTPWDYLTIQAGVVVHYLRLVFWPEGLMLSWQRTVPESPSDYLPAGLLLAGMLGAGLWALRSRPQIGFLLTAFFVLLAPTSSVLPLASEVYAERRMYLALIPVLALAIGGWLTLWPALSSGTRFGAVVPALVLLVLLAATVTTTRARLEVWRSAESLWADNVRRDPANHRARNNLAQAALEVGDLRIAEEQLVAALELKPDYTIARHNLAVARRAQGRLAEAQNLLEQVVAEAPGQVESQLLLASVACERNRCDDALDSLQLATQMLPTAAPLRVALARVHRRQGRPLEAERCLREALAVEPQYLPAYEALADLLFEEDRFDEAVAVLRLFVANHPLEARAHRRLGSLLAVFGNLDEGILQLRRATRLAPEDPLAFHNLGLALVEKGCFAAGVHALSAAVDLDPGRAEFRSALRRAQRASMEGRAVVAKGCSTPESASRS